jgi:endonuclease/exonuclease/phosphatase family metal-dependent hydrolase
VLDDDRRVLLVDAHLSSEAGDDERRHGQAAKLVALFPGTLPEIVAGDMNAVPGAAAISTVVDAGFVDAWAVVARTGESGFTAPANAPRHRIDYVLVRGGTVVEAAVIDDLGPAMSGLSDHRPVLAGIDLPPVLVSDDREESRDA